MPLALRSRAFFITLPIPIPFTSFSLHHSDPFSSYLIFYFFQYTQVGDLGLTTRLELRSLQGTDWR
jgi:hypothetical protein